MGSIEGLFSSPSRERKRAEASAQRSSAELFKRFQELRDINKADTENILAQIRAINEPLISEFRGAPGRAIGPSLIGANIQARRAGGGRGHGFSLGAASLAGQLGANVGAQAGAQQIQALQAMASLRGQETGAIGQQQGILGALAQNVLGGQGNIANTSIGAQTQAGIAQNQIGLGLAQLLIGSGSGSGSGGGGSANIDVGQILGHLLGGII